MQLFVSDIPEKGWKVEDGYYYAYTGHPKFATVLSIPVLLSFVLLLPHWYQTENTSKRRWMTLPLFLLQVWPQYRVFKLLIVLFQDREEQQKYHNKKAQHDKNITCLGKSITVFFCNERILSLSTQPKSNNRLFVYCTC
jgi:hypothetical protein